jgi:SRSO17 transposase
MLQVEPVVTAPTLDLTPQEVVGLVEELQQYHAIYAPLFQRREQRAWSAAYLRGLLADLPRKSIGPLVLALVGADRDAVRGLQHFISDGPWDDDAILRRHWQEVERDLGDDDGVLTLDGSDFPKQGRESVGVKRQYCGEVGKRANCQAGVFLGYASRHGYTLLDRRLYLPEEWVEDEAYAGRREACGVPPDAVFQTKPALGGAMIRALRQAGTLRCRWVACDEGFGRDTALLDQIAGLGLWYYAEVPHDTRGWPDRPATAVPAWSGRGRKPTRARVVDPAAAPQTAAEVAAALPASAWSRQVIKEGSKGPITADFALRRVVAVRDGLPGPAVWLVLRRNPETSEPKTYLSNAPAATPSATLVRASGMRWPIERCFEEGKQHLGLGDYEVRSWRGWHHHLTLVILAHFFLVRLQCRWGGKGPRVDAAPGPPAGQRRPAPAHGRRGLGAGRAALLAAPEPRGVPRPSQATPRTSQPVP